MVNVWTTEAAFSRLLRRMELMARAAVVVRHENNNSCRRHATDCWRYTFRHVLHSKASLCPLWWTELFFLRDWHSVLLFCICKGGMGNGSATLGGSLSPRGVWTCFELEGVLYQCTALPGMYEGEKWRGNSAK